MTPSSSGNLNELEGKWLPRWRELAQRLARKYSTEWEVWSHPLSRNGHTLGVELRGDEKNSACQVFCLVDLTFDKSETLIQTAELAWTETGVRSMFEQPVVLSETVWKKLDETLENWYEQLEDLTLLSRNQSAVRFGIAAKPIETTILPELATGEEPDFEVWSAYLASKSGYPLLCYETGGQPRSSGEDRWVKLIKDCLIRIEPNLDAKLVEAWGVNPAIRLINHFDCPETPVFVEPPVLSWGYHGTIRQLLGQHPKTSGLHLLTRVAFCNEQAFFLVMFQATTVLTPILEFVIATKLDEQWTFKVRTLNLSNIVPESE